MNINDGRMELTSNDNPALSEYFLEWNQRASWQSEPYEWFAVQGMNFDIRFPGGSVLRQDRGHLKFARDFIARVDAAMASGDFNEISSIIDIPSFVDYYLVQEFFRNQDVGGLSLFFQVRQTETGPMLFAGPLWDFDLSCGIGYPRGNIRPPQGVWAAERNRFFRFLVDTDWFRKEVGTRWQYIRDNNKVQTMIGRVNYLATTYQTCFEHNFVRWPNKNVWVIPLALVPLSFTEQVEFLTDWFQQRKLWMDEFLR